MTVEEYQAQKDKSVFGRLAAQNPLQVEGSAYQCSAMEEGDFYQDTDLTEGLPMLSMHCCMFICECRHVCVCVLLFVCVG